MIEIPQALKDKMKEQRLNQYRSQLFALEMDKAALEAVDKQAEAAQAQSAIEELLKAYIAVELM